MLGYRVWDLEYCQGYIIASQIVRTLRTVSLFNVVKPTIEYSQQRENSVTVSVSVPSVFQRKEEYHITNIDLQKVLIVRRTAVGNNDVCKRFKVWDSAEGGEDIPVSRQVVVDGIIPGRHYRVECEVTFGSELAHSSDLTITTLKPKCECFTVTCVFIARHRTTRLCTTRRDCLASKCEHLLRVFRIT